MEPRSFDDVVVYAFWPGRQTNEPHTGWGMYRTHLFIVQLFLLYALATLLVLIVVDQAGARAPAGAMGLLGGCWWEAASPCWHATTATWASTRSTGMGSHCATWGRKRCRT